MIWSPQQDRALSDVANWLRSRDQQVFRLFGYAGTGKTTLARHFAEGVGGQVLFAAYTGKAAHVMRGKGCEGASTIHRLIYQAEDVFSCPEHPEVEQHDASCRKCDGALVRRPRFSLNRDSPLGSARLLIIDECSMVSETIGRDLLSFGVPVLVLGDPFQLPPPAGCGFFTAAEPDIMLTEIHRQRRDNPIIRLSMDIRDDKRCATGLMAAAAS